MAISAVDEALEIAVSAGVRRLYTVPGESFLPLMDSAQHRAGIQVVSTRHESGAAFMADADAKVTGKPAIVSGTRAVGATNLAIGVHAAFQDSTPMVAIVGQVQSAFGGREAFQEIDLPAFFRPLVKSAVALTRADMFPEVLSRALRLATYGRPGPVAIAVPADLFHGQCEPAPHLRTWHPVPASRPLDADIDELIGAIADAQRPVVLAGGDACRHVAALVEVSERFGLGVYATFRHQDVFPNEHRHYLGHLTFSTSAAVQAALREADLVVVMGARLDEITTQAYRVPTLSSRLYQVGVDPNQLAAQVGARAITGDIGETLELLRARAPRDAPARNWDAAHQAYLTDSELPPPSSQSPVAPAEIIRAMHTVLPTDTVITNDAGNHSGFLHKYFRFSRPLTQVSTTSGAMGYGVPAAIGVKLADSRRTVVSLIGDGGYLMTGNELETAVRLGLAVTIIVMRNGMYGTIAMHQAREMARTTAIDIGDVDIAASARALGADGVTITEPDHLQDALDKALRSDRPSVLDVVCDPDIIAPGASLARIMSVASSR